MRAHVRVFKFMYVRLQLFDSVGFALVFGSFFHRRVV